MNGPEDRFGQFEMDSREKNLTHGEQFIYDWQYRRLGHFKVALVTAIAKADDYHRAKLRLAFPEEVDAYVAYAEQSGWWERVFTLANKKT